MVALLSRTLGAGSGRLGSPSDSGSPISDSALAHRIVAQPRGGQRTVVAYPPARPSQAVYQALLDGLRQIGVTLSAALPDDWVAPLADLLDAQPDVTSLRVAREPEIVAICS